MDIGHRIVRTKVIRTIKEEEEEVLAADQAEVVISPVSR